MPSILISKKSILSIKLGTALTFSSVLGVYLDFEGQINMIICFCVDFKEYKMLTICLINVVKA